LRFGVEIEIESFDGRDFSSKPLAPGEMPSGAEEVSNLISRIGLEVECHAWGHDHNNFHWVCKPDSSCGIEVCSPVVDRSRVEDIRPVIEALASHPKVKCGRNCSLHVHIDVSEFVGASPESSESLGSVLAWWVKSEPVMVDCFPARRKNSRFCRCIGMTDIFDSDERVVPCRAVSKLRDKYLTLNTNHMVSRKRKSIEFRLMEGTLDFSLVRLWVEFLFCFVESAAARGMPNDYCWLDPGEVVNLLGSEYALPWMRPRVVKNLFDAPTPFWLERARIEYRKYLRMGFFGENRSFIGVAGNK